jgi:hypothetical protein
MGADVLGEADSHFGIAGAIGGMPVPAAARRAASGERQ